VPVYYRLQGEDGLPVSPQRLRAVRLWIRHGNDAWRDGGLDLDRASPTFLEAPADGEYELYLVGADDTGTVYPLGSTASLRQPPSRDVAPHASVRVDTLEPRVRIVEPPDGATIAWQSELRVRVRIEEEHALDAAPELACSTDGGDTWTDLDATAVLEPVDGLGHHEGQLRFRVPAFETDALRLRVRQRDAAGNVGEATTDPARPLVVSAHRSDSRERARREYQRALLLFYQDDPEGQRASLAHFRTAIDLWEPFPEAHHDYAVALEAVASRAEAPPAGPAEDEAHGDDARDVREEDAPLAHYRRALELAPGLQPARFHLIRRLLALTGRPGAAPGRVKALRDEARCELAAVDRSALGRSGPDVDPATQRRFREWYEAWKDDLFAASP
jgi:hypothetical protein